VNIIFFGNTKYSTIGLQLVNKVFPISLIITKKIDFNPVKKIAENLRIPFIESDKLDNNIVEKIKSSNPDFFVVEDYGLILPKEALELPKYAPLNIHHSLLPKYRGPSPAPTAILAGDKISGVTIIKMNESVDTGDILAQKEYELSDMETTDSLLIKLNELGGQLVIDVINQFLKNIQKPLLQDNSKASFSKRFTKEDGYFDINTPPDSEKLDKMIRAYYPWPGVWCKWNGKIVKFMPNEMIQMEGKKAISVKDFLNGYPDFPLKSL